MKKRKLKLITKILLIFVITFCFTTSIFLLYLYLNYNKNKDAKLVYAYGINQNIDYSVNLYDNSFINDKNIKANEMYISELIKDINISYNFDYSATNDAKLNFKYKIIGTLNGTYQGTSSNNEQGNVWSKEYVLLDEISKEINAKNFYINQNIILDFPKYKEEVEAFKKEFGMSVSTKMDIKLIVNITGKIKENDFNKESIIELSFPLGVQAFSIETNYDEFINDKIETKTDVKLFFLANIPTIVVLFVIATSLSIIFFRDMLKLNEKNEYTKKLEKILKTYDDVIVEITTPVNIDDYEIIEVKGIEEMVDLEEELRIPINFYEHIPNYYGEFTLIHNNVLYRYIIEEKKEDI